MGAGIFRGLEVLLAELRRADYPARAGVHAIDAILTYTVGFVAWEVLRTHRQSQAAYAAKWRREFATLPPSDFPIGASILNDLGNVGGEDQFEFGLAALADGLARAGVEAGR